MPGRATFVGLWFLLTLARGVLITVIPLTAHRLFHDAQTVSEVYFVISLLALCVSLASPVLIALFRRRWVFSLGCLSLIGSAVMIWLDEPWSVPVGMALQLFGVVGTEIPLNLYILDYIPRRHLVRFEPLRLFFAAGPWTVGPWLGVKLQQVVAPEAPFVLSATIAAALLALFWALRIADRTRGAPAHARPANPLRFVPRFARQPRLRLAWILAFGRAGWWYMFFIYAPIYCVTYGLGPEVGGLLVSLGSAGIFGAPLFGWVARRVGLRRHLIWAYGTTGAITLLVALVAPWPWLGFATLLAATVFTSTIDGAGHTPFLRAVRPLERAEMTAVFMTYRDSAQLSVPGVYAVMLLVLPLPYVFVVSGLVTASLALVARYIPRRM